MSNMMWLPSVEVESFGGTRVVPLETRLLMSRRLFITGVIDNNKPLFGCKFKRD